MTKPFGAHRDDPPTSERPCGVAPGSAVSPCRKVSRVIPGQAAQFSRNRQGPCPVARHNGQMNVVSFVLARIAEDERVALSSMHRSAGSRRGLSTRGLRETAFKRRLVDDALRGVSWNFARGTDGDIHTKQPVLGRLAMVYADHPDFDARWVR